MALVLKELYHGYFWIFRDLADPRVDDSILASSPFAPTSFVLIYLYFVYTLGPKLMENRKPFEIKNIIRVYNALQIGLNAYVTVTVAISISNMDWKCGVIDYSYSSNAKRILHVGYLFYLLKIFDLMDTVFFILRKSYRQISFLHVYHHCIMVYCLWIGVRYLAGGESLWIALINGFVHTIMYLYYLLTTIDDKWKGVKYKKLLTQVQLVQFIAFILIFGRLLFKPDCSYPKWVSMAFVPQNVFMLLLFGDFYIKTYVRNKRNK